QPGQAGSVGHRQPAAIGADLGTFEPLAQLDASIRRLSRSDQASDAAAKDEQPIAPGEKRHLPYRGTMDDRLSQRLPIASPPPANAAIVAAGDHLLAIAA